jgi:hypothetical protein
LPRAAPILGLGSILAMAASVALAADVAPVAPYYAPAQPMSLGAELRLGGSAQDPFSAEKGSGNVTGEILFPKPYAPADRFWAYFVPRPTAGFSANTGGRTSVAYIGATWTVDITQRIFVEGFFGGAAHNGSTGPREFAPPGFNALGCSPMFREAGTVGYRLTERWSVMATIEHISNAGLCVDNRGLTNVGAKVGYSF